MTVLPQCSHCGARITYVNCQAQGPAQNNFDETGQSVEWTYDRLYFKPSKTVRCAECGKIRRDLMVDGQVVMAVREREACRS